MKIINSGYYRFQNDLHLDDFANSNNAVDLICNNTSYSSINIDEMASVKYLEYGATIVYRQDTKWVDNDYKKIFVENIP